MYNRCEPDIQKLIISLTFEELITTRDGMTASRALVNVVIDQQIGQQISVRLNYFCSWRECDFRLISYICNRSILSAKFCNRDVGRSVVQMTLCFTRFTFRRVCNSLQTCSHILLG